MAFNNSYLCGRGNMQKSGRGRSSNNSRFQSNVGAAEASDELSRNPPQSSSSSFINKSQNGTNVQFTTPVVSQPFVAQSTPKLREPSESPIERWAPQQVSSLSNVSAANGDPYRERLWQLYAMGKYGDLTLKVENKQFLVSKAVVSVESNYFEKLFRSNPSITQHVVSNIDPTVMEAVIEFLHRGRLDDYGKFGNALAKAAEELQIDELKEHCPSFTTQQPPAAQPPVQQPICQPPAQVQSFAQGNGRAKTYTITKQNLINSIVEALRLNDIPYQDAILAFMRANRSQVVEVEQSAELAQMAQQDPAICNAVKRVLFLK